VLPGFGRGGRIARITAERLVQHLEAPGYVLILRGRQVRLSRRMLIPNKLADLYILSLNALEDHIDKVGFLLPIDNAEAGTFSQNP
jgi:hypothetical protein